MIQPINSVKDNNILQNAIKRYAERGIILPTFDQMINPDSIPNVVKDKLKNIGINEINPLNLFRICWKNEPVEHGGGFAKVNYIELPTELTGVKARVVVMLGKYFPTGAHKVGAAYGCLAPKVITGQFDPTYNKAVWPSTGNYCRGGAFDSKLMGTESVAILPEEMSQERFDWLRNEIGSEVIATPGCESNVKEIYDKCWEIRETRPDCIIFNQFDEFGNAAWHYNVTGRALDELYSDLKTGNSQLSAYVSATGSAGTIAGGDYLRTKHPELKVVASEALQCPTLLMNGFGGHRIEGIGDKHVPWIHNVRNTNVVTAIDDTDCMQLLRLFNEPTGVKYLKSKNIDPELIDKLPLIGISGIANILSAIKTANYFEYNENDIILTIATDSAEMYGSRLVELNDSNGTYTEQRAEIDFYCSLLGQTEVNLKELSYIDQKAIHNLKYFTWIEQQGKSIEDLNQLWYDREIWSIMFRQVEKWDGLIEEFNSATGVLNHL